MSIKESQPIIIEEPYKDEKHVENLLAHQPQNLIRKQQEPLKKSSGQANQKIQPLNKLQNCIQLDDENFFKIMDLMDGYDKLLKEMNEQYCAGMLLIANVKFSNPYTSLSTKGYKPTPAITKISTPISQNSSQHQQQSTNMQSQKLFALIQQTKSIKFTNSVIESINREIQLDKNYGNVDENQDENEQIDSQSAHSSMSTANQIYTYQEEELIMEEQQCVNQCRKFVESNDNFNLQDFIMDRFSIETQKNMVSQASIKFYSLLRKLINLAEQKINILSSLNKIQKEIQCKQ